MSPTGMMRLPADRLECPLVEPSQQLWPHWSLVVLHQAAREVVYSGLEVQRKCGCSGGASSAPSVAYTPIESPSRALTSNKRVCFVRHGQGAHNRTVANWGMVDPELTSDGEAQVADLHERLKPFIPEVELIVTSPLTRAMQTATGGFAGSKAPYVMLPMLRERLGAPCDTGRTKSELLRCFPQIASWEVRGAARTWHTACAHVSRRARFVWNPYPITHARTQASTFTSASTSTSPPPPPLRLSARLRSQGIDDLPEVWWATATEYDLLDRVDELKKWITARPEQNIAVVGHGGLFSRILGYHLKNCGFQWVEWGSAASDSV